MPTLNVALQSSDAPAVVAPDTKTTLSYSQLAKAVEDARSTLSNTGLLAAQDAVSMSLINGALGEVCRLR